MTRFTFVLALAALPLAAQLAPVNSSGVSMGHLHIVSPDPAAHKKLFVEVLGGKGGKVGSLEYARFPGVVVAFREGKSSGGTDGSVVDHLGFLVRDLDGTMSKVVGAGMKIVSENPKNRQFFAMFPDGVKVEFSEDKSLKVPIEHHHVHFATNEEDKMRAWYSNLFGAVPRMRGQFKTADLPGVNLSWKPVDSALLPTKGRSVDHIGFEVTNIKALCDKAEAAGATIESQPREVPSLGLTVAFLVDPWGARIELTEGLTKF